MIGRFRAVPRAVRRLPVILAAGLAIYAAVLAWSYYTASSGPVKRHHVESAWFLIAALGVLHAVLPEEDGEDAAGKACAAPRPWAVAAIAGVATLGLYWPALGIGFLSDDFVLLGRAQAHEWFGGGSAEFVRPVPLIGWAIIAKVFGAAPIWYHAFNLALHAANAAFVWLLARRVGLESVAAAAAAAIFLVNPASVEAVAWVSGAQDLLMTTACLAFVLAALAPVTPARAALAVGVLAVGLFSKETAVVAPMLAGLAWFAAGRARVASGLRLVGLGAAVCTIYAVWRVTYIALPASFVAMPTGYDLKELVSRPYSALAVPWPASALAAHPALGLLAAWIPSLLVVAAATRPTLRLRATIMWAAWALGAVLPVYSYLYLSPELQGSRYLYLASCGWAITLVLLVRHGFAARRRPLPLAGAILVAAMVAGGWLGVRSNMAPWHRAARVSEAVIEDATRVVAGRTCAAYAFENLPDSVEGAYVFRNGFSEALRMRTADARVVAAAGDVELECRVRWNGEAFVPSGS